MANVLLTWELGGGLGHMIPLRLLGDELVRRGHRVTAALRDLSNAGKIFSDGAIPYLQAPWKAGAARDRIDPLLSMAHILNNVGFADSDELASRVRGWDTLFDLVQPDLVVVDHSPTALLALRGFPARVTAVGSGFFCPPDTSPMSPFRPLSEAECEQVTADERRVLESVNRVLQERGQTPLERLSQLFHDIDETFLATFRELDHYPDRAEPTYWGVSPHGHGKAPAWPEGPGRKVFAYLNPFKGLPALLGMLNEARLPTIVVINGADPSLVERFRSNSMRFEQELLDMAQATAECDLAILNGQAGSTAAMLLAGKPVLEIPLTVEQMMTSRNVERLGAGLGAPPNEPMRIAASLRAMLESDQYAEAARHFAERYADFDPEQQLVKIVDRMEALLE